MHLLLKPPRVLATLALLALCGSAAAQSNAQPNREREALRRAQSALQQAQQQRDALQAERASLASTSSEQQALLQRQQAQLTAAVEQRRRLAALTTEHANLKTSLDQALEALASLRTQADNERIQAQARQAEAAQQRAALQRQHAEVVSTNRALVSRLEAASKALAEARSRNQQLHAIGQAAIQRLRGLSPSERALQDDPVLGLTAVRLNDEAELLLQRLDGQRQPEAVAP
jgi:chromosome segregation ATPase